MKAISLNRAQAVIAISSAIIGGIAAYFITISNINSRLYRLENIYDTNAEEIAYWNRGAIHSQVSSLYRLELALRDFLNWAQDWERPSYNYVVNQGDNPEIHSYILRERHSHDELSIGISFEIPNLIFSESIQNLHDNELVFVLIRLGRHIAEYNSRLESVHTYTVNLDPSFLRPKVPPGANKVHIEKFLDYADENIPIMMAISEGLPDRLRRERERIIDRVLDSSLVLDD